MPAPQMFYMISNGLPQMAEQGKTTDSMHTQSVFFNFNSSKVGPRNHRVSWFGGIQATLECPRTGTANRSFHAQSLHGLDEDPCWDKTKLYIISATLHSGRESRGIEYR